jgi:Spy/CpxP family protein refolding chaperone
MNKLFILTTALLISIGATAQQPQRKGPPPPNWRNAQDKKQSMLEELDLTDAQKEQLKKEHEKALEKVLTPEQKKQRKEMLDKQSARKDSAQKRQAQHLQKMLHLSDEQTSKLIAQQEKFQESMKKFKKEANAQMIEHREKMRTLMEEQSNNLKQILSPEQLEKYKYMMRERMRKMREGGPLRNKIQNNEPSRRRPIDIQDGPPPPPRPRKIDSTDSI